MENKLDIKQVPFMGTSLMAARDADGQIWAGVRWMCDGLGLSEGQRKRQVANIQADKVLSKGGSNLILPTKGGNQEVLCLALDFVPLWLAKISITPTMEAETPELAKTLEQYQLHAKNILAAAFLPVNVVTDIDSLSPELRLLINMELKQKEQARVIEAVNQRVDDIRDVVALNPIQWREESQSIIANIARSLGGVEHIRDIHAEIYELVDARAGCSLKRRLENLRSRMAMEGGSKSKIKVLNKLDVIAQDKKLIEIYIAIVKKMAVKYGVTNEEEL